MCLPGVVIEPNELTNQTKGRSLIQLRIFLERIKNPDLALDIWDTRFTPPTRSWIKNLINKTYLHLHDRRIIKYQRLTACSRTIFVDFFLKFGGYISAISPFLFFCCWWDNARYRASYESLSSRQYHEAITAELCRHTKSFEAINKVL